MASNVQLQELLDYLEMTEAQLQKVCSDRHINEIALHLSPWELFATYLGLTNDEIEDIKEEEKRNQKLQSVRSLQKWKSKYVDSATYLMIAEVCLQLGNAALAEKICILAKGVSATPPAASTPPAAPTTKPSTPSPASSHAPQVQVPQAAPRQTHSTPNPVVTVPPSTVQPPSQPISPHPPSVVRQSSTRKAIKQTDRPRLPQLMKLKNNQVDISVIKTVAPDWKRFGLGMDFDDDGQFLELIAANDSLRTPVDRCTKMFQHWLNGNGVQPVSWETLVDLLYNEDKAHLAKQIESMYI